MWLHSLILVFNVLVASESLASNLYPDISDGPLSKFPLSLRNAVGMSVDDIDCMLLAADLIDFAIR